MSSPTSQPSCCSSSSRIETRIYILIGLLLVLCLAAEAGPILGPFRYHFLAYVEKIWWAVGLGILIGGWIDHYVSREYVSFELSNHRRGSVFKAVGLGFLMTACCHGIIAIAMQLYRKGASTSCVVAFLLASPWANLTWTILLLGFFGWVKALYIIGVSLMIAIVTGSIFQFLEASDRVERNPNTPQFSTERPRFWNIPAGRRWTRQVVAADLRSLGGGMIVLMNMVLFWALLGVSLAAVVAAYVPSDWMQVYMGPTAVGLFVTLALASMIEVCSEGSTPIAFEIYRQTGAVGNSLVFLLAGVATDYTEIAILWQNIGRRTALWVPLLSVPQILFWGWLGNMMF